MSELIEAKGSCLCGAVRFTAAKVSKGVGACHCGMCRKWGGGPLMAVTSGSDVLFEGDEYISVYDSSAWAERGFCKRCGTHMFYRLKESSQHIIPVGLFNGQDSFVFDSQIFIDKQPSYYSFENQTENMTEAEVFEKYGG